MPEMFGYNVKIAMPAAVVITGIPGHHTVPVKCRLNGDERLELYISAADIARIIQAHGRGDVFTEPGE